MSKLPPNRTESYMTLCPVGQMVATSLDGASERAVLVAADGTTLYMNPPAKGFLCKTSQKHVTDFLVTDDWLNVKHCCVVMQNGTSTHNFRNITVRQLDICPCCNQQYYVIYICGKYERVRKVVDNSLDAVFTVDESGIICTVNKASLKLFGYEEKELVGQDIKIICGGGHGEHHHQYMKNYLQTGIKKVIGKKREVPARKKDGTEFPVELGLQEISSQGGEKRFFVGFIKDLTQLKTHEDELQERRALAEGMINASFEPMIEIDDKGEIKLVNQAACALLGYTREEFIGSNISMICGGGHAEKHASYLKKYMETGVKHIIGRKRQVKARRKDGSEIEVELGVQEVTLKGGKKAFCGYIRDLTQQKKDKRALIKQQQLIHGKFFGSE